MTFSDDALRLVKEFEGLRTTAYRDSAGVLTIGYGHTRDVTEGMTVTAEFAQQLAREDLTIAQAQLLVLPADVQSALSQGQWDALCDWVFNLGAGNWQGSTLRQKVLAMDWSGAAEELVKWDHAGGKVLEGLVARRAAELSLFTAADTGADG